MTHAHVGPDLGPRFACVIGIAATPGVTKVTPYIRLFCLAAGDKAEIQSIACKQASYLRDRRPEHNPCRGSRGLTRMTEVLSATIRDIRGKGFPNPRGEKFIQPTYRGLD